MKRFKNILCVVPRGGTGKLALERAVSLAECNQADLTVVGVMAPFSIGMGMPDGGPISAELQRVMLSTCREELNCGVSLRLPSCVKTKNSKPQVGITLYISWFQSMM